METIKILYVEDNKSIAEMFMHKLKMEGYSGLYSPNGRDALKCIDSFQPDIVITDIMMPEMDGLTLISEIRKLPLGGNFKIIVFTNVPDDFMFRKIFQNGGDAYLIKSNTTPRTLYETIRDDITKTPTLEDLSLITLRKEIVKQNTWNIEAFKSASNDNLYSLTK